MPVFDPLTYEFCEENIELTNSSMPTTNEEYFNVKLHSPQTIESLKCKKPAATTSLNNSINSNLEIDEDNNSSLADEEKMVEYKPTRTPKRKTITEISKTKVPENESDKNSKSLTRRVLENESDKNSKSRQHRVLENESDKNSKSRSHRIQENESDKNLKSRPHRAPKAIAFPEIVEKIVPEKLEKISSSRSPEKPVEKDIEKVLSIFKPQSFQKADVPKNTIYVTTEKIMEENLKIEKDKILAKSPSNSNSAHEISEKLEKIPAKISQQIAEESPVSDPVLCTREISKKLDIEPEKLSAKISKQIGEEIPVLDPVVSTREIPEIENLQNEITIDAGIEEGEILDSDENVELKLEKNINKLIMNNETKQPIPESRGSAKRKSS
jgi:hypothetical protein